MYKKVIVCGIRDAARAALTHLSENYHVVAIADIDGNIRSGGAVFEGYHVIYIDDIVEYDYDYIVIASFMGYEVKAQLIRLGIGSERIIDFYHTSEIIQDGYHDLMFDARRSILRMCVKEIVRKNVKGQIAELGVYKGDFAKYMNQLFPDKTLYLFDSFSGFDERDVEIEIENCYSDGKQIQSDKFADTSLEIVLQQMKYKEKCIIRKGYFPQTLENEDYDESFCMVSLDADLYLPTYEGLKFFYPRLEKGGYMFVHDYSSLGYRGVKEAMLRFEEEEPIQFVPINDFVGTAVICK